MHFTFQWHIAFGIAVANNYKHCFFNNFLFATMLFQVLCALYSTYLSVLHKKIEFERVNQEKRLVEFAGYMTLAGNQQ